MGFPPDVGERDRDRVIVLGRVHQTADRAEVRVPQQAPCLHLQNLAMVLIPPALPVARPRDRTPFLPIGANISAKHVLLDDRGTHERRPDLAWRGIDRDIGSGDQILSRWHLSLRLVSLSYPLRRDRSIGRIKPRS